MKFSKIKYHELRDYWKNETSDFSYWLSRENNLDLLSQTIGINLEFVKREASKNSRYRIDILAKNKDTGETVIIENQLETTDHQHLGKLITYATLFQSRTIIWIVKDVRKEHELAVNWLNKNSKEEVNIFLLKIELISIDSSSPAPLLTILSKPHNYNIPKLKKDLGLEFIEQTEKRSEIEEKMWDKKIIDFFDNSLSVDIKYAKKKYDENDIGILNLLKSYDINLYTKYNTSYSRELKKDLILWARLRELKVNQKQFKKSGSRDFKSGGKEFFVLTFDEV